MTTAGELCVREVVFVRPDDRVITAARLMRELDVGCVVVAHDIEGKREPIGILTDRDIVVEMVALDISDFHALDVDEVLTRPIVTARDDEDIFAVLSRMRTQGVRRVPVVDQDGVLQGVLSADDVLEFLVDELGRLAGIVSAERKTERAMRI